MCNVDVCNEMSVESIVKGMKFDVGYDYYAAASLTLRSDGGAIVELEYSTTSGWNLVSSDYNNHPLIQNADEIDDFVWEKVCNKVVWVDDMFDDLMQNIENEFK